jgi:MOSC domain-containing protein YiiM
VKVVSVNMGLPRELTWKGAPVTTGIFKAPVKGRVRVRALNLDGDRQADLSVHGGRDKAVYAYPSEHYALWEQEFPELELPWGMFGENLTTEGLREESVCLGDRFRIGSAEVQVTQPRIPCYKLGIRFGGEEIISRFLESGRSGFYLAVVREGELEAGDVIEVLERDASGVTVAEFQQVYTSKKPDRDLMERAVRVEALAEGWRERLLRRLRSGER